MSPLDCDDESIPFSSFIIDPCITTESSLQNIILDLRETRKVYRGSRQKECSDEMYRSNACGGGDFMVSLSS